MLCSRGFHVGPLMWVLGNVSPIINRVHLRSIDLVTSNSILSKEAWCYIDSAFGTMTFWSDEAWGVDFDESDFVSYSERYNSTRPHLKTYDVCSAV